MSPLYAYRS